MARPPSPEELLQRAMRGDIDGFMGLYDMYVETVNHYHQLCSTNVEACVEATFKQALGNVRTARCSPRAWLLRLARANRDVATFQVQRHHYFPPLVRQLQNLPPDVQECMVLWEIVLSKPRTNELAYIMGVHESHVAELRCAGLLGR